MEFSSNLPKQQSYIGYAKNTLTQQSYSSQLTIPNVSSLYLQHKQQEAEALPFFDLNLMDPRRWVSVDVLRQKHEVLLQEYLVLQKECVSKKRKLKEANERKQTLMDEIRFLKRRRDLLLRIDSQELEGQHEAVESQKSVAKLPKYNGETSRRYFDANEPPFQNLNTVGALWKSSSSIGKGEVGLAALRLGKKVKDLFSNGKRGEKRKICWQDPVALKV